MQENNNTSMSEKENRPKGKDKDKQKASEDIIEADVLDKLPEEVKRVVQIGMSMQRTSMPVYPQLLSKLNEGHITKILDLSEKDDDRVFKDIQSSRKFTLTYVIIFIALFVFITLFLVGKNPALYQDILKVIVVFAGGLGSGYGLKTYLEKRK
ncbi:MAG: hypothetical protein K8R79_07255 [Calditrichales bacterium]|nr:hypothetical protein [Calditrichales bacterium]